MSIVMNHNAPQHVVQKHSDNLYNQYILVACMIVHILKHREL